VKVLFDEGTPVPLRQALVNHTVETAQERGWSGLKNGELIAAAEVAGFEVFVTTDQNLKYQQNLGARKLAVVVLRTTSWPRIQRSVAAVVAAIGAAAPGSYTEVAVE
jgi:predicted nuclease of predicted toxin-antitoxin system